MTPTPTLRELTISYTTKKDSRGECIPVGPVCRTPADSAAILTPLLEAEPSEVFAILCLTTKHCVIAFHEISRGGLSGTIVEPRSIFRAALLTNAAAVILAHNHPSGDPTPSPEDIAITARMVSAGAVLGIDVLDHIVITGDAFISILHPVTDSSTCRTRLPARARRRRFPARTGNVRAAPEQPDSPTAPASASAP
jgi:DNA repair protein RadC